jgi:pantoate kinase
MDVAQAFVPGHAAGFLTVDRDDDPTKAGSRGGGLTLSTGVTVTVRRADDPAVALNGEPVEMGAVDRVLDALDAPAAVRARTDLPRGAGLGVSGGMALGAALAVNAVFERGLSVNELVTVAHGAEVQAGTGFGDVIAQARGGAPIRLEPGGPHHNVVDAIPARSRVEFRAVGDGGAVGLDGDHVAAGETALSRLVREPTLPTLMRAAREFSRESGLLTEDVRRVIQDVADAGGSAAMAVPGRAVFALGTGLSDAGYDPGVARLHPGATLEPVG